MEGLGRLPLSGPPHLVAAHGLRYGENPYTSQDGTAKLARDRQLPYMTDQKNGVSYT